MLHQTKICWNCVAMKFNDLNNELLKYNREEVQMITYRIYFI
jgi:hypothetical protein